MAHMEELGIYVMIAATPGSTDYFGSYRWSTMGKIHGPDDSPSCYPSYLLHYGKSIAKMLAPYNHTLGLVMGNEVLQTSLTAAACVKQYVADLKTWMRSNSDRMRLLPLAYAAADGAYVGAGARLDQNAYAAVKIQGLLCGDEMVNGQMTKSIDIYLINEYRWCKGMTFEQAYGDLMTMASGVPIVMGLGEYGCDKDPPRDFAMIQYLFGDSAVSKGFSDIFSGGYVYSFGQANLGLDTNFPLFTGGSQSIDGLPGTVPTEAYNNLKMQFKKYPPLTSNNAGWDPSTPSSKCTWAPTLASKISPRNQRATQLGWIISKCTDAVLSPTDSWITSSRNGAPCNSNDDPCDVTVPLDPKVLSQKQLCDLQGNTSSGLSGGSGSSNPSGDSNPSGSRGASGSKNTSSSSGVVVSMLSLISGAFIWLLCLL